MKYSNYRCPELRNFCKSSMADFKIKNYVYNTDECCDYIDSLDLNYGIDNEGSNEFLLTSVSDSIDDGKYVIKGFGIYPNGKQKMLYITGIKPYVDVLPVPTPEDPLTGVPGRSSESILTEVDGIASGCWTGYGERRVWPEKSTTKGKYLIGINKEEDWTRYTFTSLFARTKFLKGIQYLYASGKLLKSNDKRNDYMIIAARHHGFSLSAWNTLEGEPESSPGDAIYYDVSKVKRCKTPSTQAMQYNNTSITWDIETYYLDYENRGDGVPLPDDLNAAMSCISIVVKRGKTIKSLTTLSTYGSVNFTPPEGRIVAATNKKEVRTDMTVNSHIVCADEKEMLKAFLEIVRVVSPDLMIAFNDFDYDWKWIIKRTLRYKLNAEAYCAFSGNVYFNKLSGSPAYKAEEARSWWTSAYEDTFGVTAGDDLDDDNLDDELEGVELDGDSDLEEEPDELDVAIGGGAAPVAEQGVISTPTKKQIKLEAGEYMICVFPNTFCRMIFVDTRVILRKANPKLDTSSLNFYLEANGLGKKNDMSHNVAQELTAALRLAGGPGGDISGFDFEKHRAELEGIGIADYRNVDEILAIMLNYCLVDSVKTAILLDKSEEVLSKRMLADISHVGIIHAFYSGVSVQITNILSEYCDKSSFNLKYSTDSPLDKDTSGKKYAGALVLPPVICGSFTILNIREKYEQQLYYLLGDGRMEDTMLDVMFKELNDTGHGGKTKIAEFIVDSVHLTDFTQAHDLDSLLSPALPDKKEREDFFVSMKGFADAHVNMDNKLRHLKFYLNECIRTLEHPEYTGRFDDNTWLPPRQDRGGEGGYAFIDEIVNGIWPGDTPGGTPGTPGTHGGPPPGIAEDIKNLYRMFVYVNTTLNDYYTLDTKDVPVGQLIWLPRFPRKKLDYIELTYQVSDAIQAYEQSVRAIKSQIINTLRRAGCTPKQILFLMEVTGLATTALDFASLYPSIIEEFNLSIDKMIISSDNPELYDQYVDNPEYKTIYCFYGSDNPRTAHCKNHNNNTEDYGVYSYILRELKIIRTSIRKILAQVDEQNLSLLLGLGKKKPDGADEEGLLSAWQDQRAEAEAKGSLDTWLEEQEALCDDLSNQSGVLNSKQNAVKVVMNSFYGSTGNKNSQARCIEMSAGITAEGVKHLKLARDVIEEMGVTIRYGDTDSLYFSRPIMSSRDDLLAFFRDEIDSLEFNKRDVTAAIYWAAAAQKVINDTIKAKNNNAGIMKMAYEEALKPFFNLNKKRYFGLVHLDPKNVSFDISDKKYFFAKRMFVRGMDFKKRSSTPIGVEVLKEVLYFMLDQSNVRGANGQGIPAPRPGSIVPFGNPVAFIKQKLRDIVQVGGNDRNDLIEKFAKKVMVKKKPNIVVASLYDRLPTYELTVGSSVRVVVAVDKEPPTSAKGTKAIVTKTHRTYPVDYMIQHQELELDLAGYLEGQFATQLSDIISFLYQTNVSKYITAYNETTTRVPLAINDIDVRTKVLKDLAINSIKRFIQEIAGENRLYTDEQLAEYKGFCATVYKELQNRQDYQALDLGGAPRGGAGGHPGVLRLPLSIVQKGLGKPDAKWKFIDIIPQEEGEAPRRNGAGLTVTPNSRKDKTIHPNFKIRGSKKKEDVVCAVNLSNRKWLVDMLLNMWDITPGKDLNELDIVKLRANFIKYKIPFLEKLDDIVAIDKFIDKLILQNRTHINDYLDRPDRRVEESVDNIIRTLQNTPLSNQTTRDLVVFFGKIAEKSR